MTINDFKEKILTSKVKSRDNHLRKLISVEDNKRQDIIKTNKDYYEGNQWNFKEGVTNTTRSGKKTFGKFAKIYDNKAVTQTDDPFDRQNRRRSNFEISFHKGQIQTRNKIKKVIQFYQDEVLGSNHEEIEIVAKQGEQEISEDLKSKVENLWSEKEIIIKRLVATGVITTIMPLKLSYDSLSDDYFVEVQDPEKLFPIYKGEKLAGYMKAYLMTKEEGEAYVDDIKEDDCVYAECFFMIGENEIGFVRIVDGKFIYIDEDENTTATDNFSEAIINLQDELNYMPLEFVSNIDHPYRRFDDKTLEDSEIFTLIDLQDALNTNETLAFLGNLTYALPKPKLDMDQVEKMGVDINSPEFKQALNLYQYSPFQIDKIPVTTEQKGELKESFYKYIDRLIDSIYEEASVPRFMINSTGMSNVSERTVMLALNTMLKKLHQKRDQVTHLITKITEKYLELITGSDDFEITINYPDIIVPTKEELKEIYLQSSDRDIFPKKYIQERMLEIVGKEEDAAEVKQLTEAEIDRVIANVRTQRSRIAQQQRTTQDSNLQSELEATNEIINQIQNGGS